MSNNITLSINLLNAPSLCMDYLHERVNISSSNCVHYVGKWVSKLF